MPALSPYETVSIYGKTAPTHIPPSAVDDAKRVTAYEVYEGLYDNQATVFVAVLKTETGNEVYRRLIPTARSLVEASNRYLARGLAWSAAPSAPATGAEASGEAVDEEAIDATMATLDTLFVREEFSAKFLSLKRWMLIRGDAMLHVTADPSKPEGTRIRIVELNPASYFAIPDPADSERVIGCYIINLILDDEGDEIAARLEYRRMLDQEAASKYSTPLGGIYVKLSFYSSAGWDDRVSDEDLEPVAAPSRFSDPRFAALLAGQALPAEITAIPVYHFRNRRRGSAVFGISELQGLETIINGINQAATDEDVSVALQGIGVYWTNSGRPLDDNGDPVDWEISPASIIELAAGGQFGRVDGVSSVAPMQDHIELLRGSAQESSGTPKIAVGSVEADSVSSGVALSLQMAPMVAKSEESEEEITAKLLQMLFDLLNGWLPAYEGIAPLGVTVSPVFDDPIPKNTKEIIENIARLVEAKIASAEWARGYLAEVLGLQFGGSEGQAIASEASALLDVEGARMDAAVADPAAEVGL